MRNVPVSSAPRSCALAVGVQATEAPAASALQADFEALVRRETPHLLAVARRILRCDEDARDALQDALLSAFRRLPDFRGEAQLSTWLHRIVINAALMKLRSRGRRREEAIEPLLPSFDADGHRIDPDGAWRTPEETLDREELAALVRASIDRLPANYRTVLMLRDIEGLDTDETAQALDLRRDAVKMRLHRARQALRELLAPHFARPE